MRNRSPMGGAGLVVAIVALVAALTGAAIGLPGKGSVDSGDIKKNAVKAKHLKSSALKCPGDMRRSKGLCYDKVAHAADDHLTATYDCAQSGKQLPTWGEMLRIAHTSAFPATNEEKWTQGPDFSGSLMVVNKIASNNIPSVFRPAGNNRKYHCVQLALP